MLGEESQEGSEVALIGGERMGRSALLAGKPGAPIPDLFKKIGRRKKGDRGGIQGFRPSQCRMQCSSTRARKVNSSVP